MILHAFIVKELTFRKIGRMGSNFVLTYLLILKDGFLGAA